MIPRTRIALSLLAVLGLAGAAYAATAWREALAPDLDAPAAQAGAFRIEYTLWNVQGEERYLLETTSYEAAAEANATQGRVLLAPEEYGARTLHWENLSTPRAIAEFALARIDPALLVPGQPFDVVVEDAMGRAEDLVRGSVPRRSGPYPLEYDLSLAEFRAAMGHEPVVGDEVNTTSVFSAFVESVERGSVHLRVNLKDEWAIRSRPLASIFSVEKSADATEFWLTLVPIRDSVFRLPVENVALGLAPGNYLWTNVTEERAEYEMHPDVSPIWPGVDFRIAGVVLEGSA